MTSALLYISTYARRRAGRLALTTLGLTVSFAAVSYSYGIACTLDAESTRVLREVVGDAPIWIVPPAGVAVDARTGGIVSLGRLDDAIVAFIRGRDPSQRWIRVRVGKVTIAGAPTILYCDERFVGPLGLIVSAQSNVPTFSVRPGSIVEVDGYRLPVRALRNDLPRGMAFASFETASRVWGPTSGVSWMISASKHVDPIVTSLTEDPRFELRSTPSAAASARALAVVVTTGGSHSRFDPYTFRTRFSALVVNGALASTFGWAARFVFALGLLLTFSSSLIGVAERCDELAWFTVKGLLPTFTVLLLIESAIFGFISFGLGTAVAVILLTARLSPGTDWSFVLGGAIASSATYAPLVILLGALVPAQSAAARTPAQVIRSSL